MNRKIRFVIFCLIFVVVMYFCYRYFYIMNQINFNKEMYYTTVWEYKDKKCKYYGLSNDKFNIDDYIENEKLIYSHNYDIDNSINSPKDAVKSVLSIFEGKYASGYDVHYELNSKRWVVIPIYRTDITYLAESLAIYVIDDNKLVFYWDGLR